MYWKQMSADEYALFQLANGVRVKKKNGCWWAEVRPFLFRPLFPFAEIDPGSAQYPVKSLVGGIQHLVPAGSTTNSFMNFFVYDDLQGYALAGLSSKTRRRIKCGLKHFCARPIADVDTFGHEAYPVYVDFHNRTNYRYKEERLNRKYFEQWAETVFGTTKVVVMGAYNNGKLAAVDISYRVEDVIIDATFFSDTPSQSLQVTDFMLHTLREAAASSDARYIYRGMPTGQRMIDEAKILRGCRLLKLPAYYRFNPVALCTARLFMKKSFNKLTGAI